jgi:lysophospholipase L1-like esterase
MRTITLVSLLLLGTLSYSQGADWANLKKYEGENAALITGGPVAGRIVFMGDSITEFWKTNDPSFFANGNIDRGISGQTSSQMLLRFRPDVISLKPAVVVILAGTNDIAGNTGPVSDETVLGNIMSMTELAQANGIKVVLCAVLPATEFWWRKELQPAERIMAFNAKLRTYADTRHIPFVDYHKAMADARHGLPKQYAEDGVHPNLAGYKVMEPLVEEGIRAALSQK